MFLRYYFIEYAQLYMKFFQERTQFKEVKKINKFI